MKLAVEMKESRLGVKQVDSVLRSKQSLYREKGAPNLFGFFFRTGPHFKILKKVLNFVFEPIKVIKTSEKVKNNI